MRSISLMDDPTLVEELPSLWAHTKDGFVEFPTTQKRPFYGGFRMEMHQHDWYMVMWVSPERTMHMRLCVLDGSKTVMADRLILKTIVPVVDLLWLPRPGSPRLVSSEFNRLIKKASQQDLPHVCRDVLRMMCNHLMQKLDTGSYQYELSELIDTAEW